MNYRYILGRTSTPCSGKKKPSYRCGSSPFGWKKNNRNISWKLTQATLYFLKVTSQKHLCSQVISSAPLSRRLSRFFVFDELQVTCTYVNLSLERTGRRKRVSGLVCAPSRKNVLLSLLVELEGCANTFQHTECQEGKFQMLLRIYLCCVSTG